MLRFMKQSTTDRDVLRPELPRRCSSRAWRCSPCSTTALLLAFPDITRSFPVVAASQLSWVLNGYTIVFAALLIPSGKLADRRRPQDPVPRRLGRVHRRLGAVADAPEPWTLIAQVLQALGGAALVPSSLALVLRLLPSRIPMRAGRVGATGAVAGAVGPTLGAHRSSRPPAARWCS